MIKRRLTMRLVIDGKDKFVINGTESERGTQWIDSEVKEFCPQGLPPGLLPGLMKNKSIQKTSAALDKYVIKLQRQNLIPKTDYTIAIDFKPIK